VSNVPTIPYMNGGGVCTDAYTGLSGTTITNLTSQTNVKSGSVIIAQGTAPGTGGTPTTADIAIADFQQVVGTSTFSSSGFESLGTCALTQSFQSTGTSTVTETGINAGTITVTTPGGSTVTLQTIPIEAGLYEGELPAGSIPTSGGTFTINGSGGTGTPSAGPFTATVNFPNPIQWTNESASATVTRTGGQTYTWSGGSANTYVLVTGSSTSGSASGSYSCIFPQSAGQGTVPEYILLGLPAGTGTSTLENSTPFGSFTATGIDYGITFGYIGFTTNTTWQ
jgi:hypothetical protein